MQRMHSKFGRHGASGGHQRLRHDLPTEHATFGAGRVMGAKLVQFDRFEIEDFQQIGECGVHGAGV